MIDITGGHTLTYIPAMTTEKTTTAQDRVRDRMQEICDSTTVVLCRPLYGGNVGSCCRAMHNFGFRHLRLVAPRAEIGLEARKMAMYSQDILESAEIYDTLGDAIAGMDVTIGTTRRLGKRRSRFFTPRDAAVQFAGLGTQKKRAIVFGAEDSGLANEEIDLCDWLVCISTMTAFDSLNLSHAVAVVLYEFNTQMAIAHARKDCDRQHGEGLALHIEKLLRASGFLPEKTDPRRVMLSLRKIIERAGLTRREIHMLHAILGVVESRIDPPSG